MIHKRIYLFYSIMATMSLTSCSDFFDTSITIDPPPYEKTLVVEGIAESGTVEVNIRISKNVGILENAYIADLIIKDAEVYLYVNGEKFTASGQEGMRDSEYFYKVVLPTPLVSGDVLKIEAIHPDFPKANATITLLPETDLISAIYNENGGLDPSGDEKSKISVKFLDKPGKNFYAVQILVPDYDSLLRRAYLSSLDPSASESHLGQTLLISDESFDGDEKILDFLIDVVHFQVVKGRATVIWYSISEEYYNFSRTMNAHQNGQGNPFGTPIPVTNNIEGGVGIFAGFTKQLIVVE